MKTCLSQAFKILLLGFTTALPCVLQGQTTVHFPDPNLEAAVREELDMPTGDLTPLDLQRLGQLIGWERGITNLTGLEWATNLNHLDIGENQIADLSPLRGLVSLHDLQVNYNRVRNLTPLLGLTNLTSLEIGGNPARDYSALSRLTNLIDLMLDNACVARVDWISSLTNLQMLWLPCNEITDPAPLAGLTQLHTLSLDHNPLADPESLRGFTNLHVLHIGGTNITSLDWLAGLPQLQSVEVISSGVCDLAPLGALTNLDSLSLFWNPLTNYDQVGVLTNLTSLILDDSTVSNLDWVQGLTGLRSLYLYYTRVSDLAPLATLPNLSGVTASYGRVTNLAGLDQLTNLHFVQVTGNLLDVSPGSAAMEVITNLESRGVQVIYLPQNQPPTLQLRTNWSIAADRLSWLPFQALDDTYFSNPLVFGVISSNPGLIGEARVVPGRSEAGGWDLEVTPAAGQTGTTLLTATATDENGLSNKATIRVEVVLPDGFDGQSVNCPGLVWRTAGTPPWLGQGEESHDGVAAAQSGGAGSWLETTVTGPGTFSFWYKAGSDFNRAGGLFSASCADSGLTGSVWLESTTAWRREEVGLPAGTWVLRWDAYTEPWVEAGAGPLWLDEVSFSPGAPACRLEQEPESYLGEVGLLLHGEPGATYDLETSGDLRNWSALSRIRLDNFVSWYGDPNWYAEARFWRLRKVSESR